MKRILSLCFLLLNLTVYAQKKPLDHTIYDQWQSIKDVIISNDGNWMSYTINPQEGDGQLIIHHLKKGQQFKIERGTQVQFSENSNFIIAKIKPTFNETRLAKIAKKKPEEMPKDSIVVIDLLANVSKKIASVKSFQIAEHNSTILVYLKDKKGDISKEGSDLIVYNLQNKSERILNNVLQYQIQSYGESLALIKAKTKTTPAQVLLTHTNDSVSKILSANFYNASNLSWDEKGQQLAYLIEKDSTNKALQKDLTLAYYTTLSNNTNGADSAKYVFDRKHISMPFQYTIGGDKKLNFSKSGAILTFGIQPILPIKDTSLPEFDRVSVDIWNYNDANLQSTQLKSLEANLKSTEAMLFRPSLNQFTYLGQISDRQIQYTSEGDGSIAIATIDSNYTIASQWEGYGKRDLYAIQTANGTKQLIQKGLKGNLVTASYDGSMIVYYDEISKQYKSFNTKTNQTKQIAKDIPFPLYDEDNDVPDDPNAYGIAMWMDNNKSFILYDRYDLWLVDATGINTSQLLTKGRTAKRIYRFVNLNQDKKNIGFNDTILLKSFNELDKNEGLSLLDLGKRSIFNIIDKPMHFTTVIGSKNNMDFIVMQEDEKNTPNVYPYIFDNKIQSPNPLAIINTQQANYNWMQSKLVKWKSYTNKTAEGILYLPEDFDAKKKYPMIVYFYERNNQTLHNYLPPSPTPSRLNIPFFVSRGYVVFVPDIWYKKGYPGQGAYDYIVSGTRAMIQKGFIDSTRIGLQGQSWGGYQIAYLITKTNLYAAAWAGAPVVNMTSAYGGIRWGAGINRQFQYEKTQSRIGANLWERPDLYIKNSPLFELNKVKTPIVIMSNDADDAVPWYQGIEMFTAMRRLSKPIWMLVYNNEAHNLVERKNRKDIQIREQQFFDHYLKGAPMPVWMSKGVPAIMKGRDLGLGY
jgi:dipeptidyl aminopeptidase/acylaminoacyl peptidase